MKRTLSLVLTLLVILAALGAAAAGKDDILGTWLNEEKDAEILLYDCGGKICGKIAWLKFPEYPADSKDGAPGTPKLDHRNPDEALRAAPLLGLEIVKGMVYLEENKWSEGTVYDSKSGKTYSAKFTLVDPDNLDLRGYVGISLFGRTSHWTRKK